MTIQIGVQIPPHYGDLDVMRRRWVEVEELGVDALFIDDHFLPPKEAGTRFECWTLLAAMAVVTERVQLGPLVACNSYRNPNLLADMARTVDRLSGGRLVFGIGSGWFKPDYDEYGYEFGTVGSRLRDLEAAIPVIKDRFSKLKPPPQGPMPLLIGGGGEKVTLRIVAEHADIWHGIFWGLGASIDAFTHKSGVLDEWCAKIGRDPKEIKRSLTLMPQEVERAEALADAGCNLLVVSVAGPDFDLGPLAELLAWRNARSRSSITNATSHRHPPS